MLMNNKKLDYVSPELTTFTVQTEGVICESTNSVTIVDWVDDGQQSLVF